MAGSAAIELTGVARRFGRRWALRGIDLRVDAGSVLALRGRNGSGKTTVLRICATLLRPTRGGGQVFGLDLLDDAATVRSRVGFLAHQPGLYDDLTGAENLRFAARMCALPADNALIDAVLDRVGLRAEAGERARTFSAGMRRRLALARLLLRPPSLLLLDEPYASFDDDGVALVNGFAAEVAQAGGVVLIATHETARGRAIIDREVVIRAGRLENEHATDAMVAPAAGGLRAGD